MSQVKRYTSLTPLFHHETLEPVDWPADLDYRTEDTCDNCEEFGSGTMYHAAGATGRVCPVLFLCDECKP